MPKTQKKNSDSEGSPAKKAKTISMKFDFSPMKKKSKWGSSIDVFETAVSPLVILVATRFDKPEGTYINPMVEAFEQDHTGKLAEEWKLLGFFSRRAASENTEMKKGPGNSYNWEAMVAIKKDDSDTAESLGKNLAAKFTEFVKKSPKVCIVKIVSFCSILFDMAHSCCD